MRRQRRQVGWGPQNWCGPKEATGEERPSGRPAIANLPFLPSRPSIDARVGEVEGGSRDASGDAQLQPPQRDGPKRGQQERILHVRHALVGDEQPVLCIEEGSRESL